MGLNGIELIQDCSIELTIGRRYGLIGQNGCGKTNFLQCLANREVGLVLTTSPAPVALQAHVCWHCCRHSTRCQWRSCARAADHLRHNGSAEGRRPPTTAEGLSCCSPDWLRRFPQVPIPDHMDLYHLSEEVEPTPRTALETVVDYIKNEIDRLNKLEEHILETVGPEDERLQVSLSCQGLGFSQLACETVYWQQLVWSTYCATCLCVLVKTNVSCSMSAADELHRMREGHLRPAG